MKLMDADRSKQYIRRKLPPDLRITTTVVVLILIFGNHGAIFISNQWDVVIFTTGLFGGLLLFLHLIDRGYRLAWDEDRIYMRHWGYKDIFVRHPEHSIGYDEIIGMEGKFKGSRAKARYMPFEFLELQSSVPEEDDIWIYPPSLKEAEVKELLTHLYEKRSEIFPDYALTYMNSDALL